MERNLRGGKRLRHLPRGAMAALVAYDPRHGACIWSSLRELFPIQAKVRVRTVRSSRPLDCHMCSTSSVASLRQRNGVGTSSPPCGVDPAVASPSGSASSTSEREQASPKAAIEPVRPVQPPVKPLAVKSKAAKPGLGSPKAPEHLPSIPEQDLLRALYAHLQTQTGGHRIVGLGARPPSNWCS